MKKQFQKIGYALIGLLLTTFSGMINTGCTPGMAKGQNLTQYLDTTMPEFALKDYAGNEIQAKDYRGKYLVLHFATTWCPFCNAEAPHLEQLSQDYQDKGVKVLIIDVKEDQELVKKSLIDRFNLTFPVIFDTDGSVATSFAPAGVLPDLSRDEVMLASNLLIDPEGKIRFFSLLDTNNFDAQLNELKSVLDELL